MDRSTIGGVRKRENRIRKTPGVSSNVSAKKIISPHYNPLIHMESALVAWIVDCSKNNVFLNKTIIGAKALSSYKHFDKENDQNSAELKTIPRICCQRSQVVRSLRNHFLLADGL